VITRLCQFVVENIFILPKLNISFEYHRFFGISNICIRWSIFNFERVRFGAVYYSLDLTGVTMPTASSQRISRDGETRYQLSLRSWAEGGATRHQTPSESRFMETPSKIIRMLLAPDIEARRAIFMLLFRRV